MAIAHRAVERRLAILNWWSGLVAACCVRDEMWEEKHALGETACGRSAFIIHKPVSDYEG
jgi:hypothetical protein